MSKEYNPMETGMKVGGEVYKEISRLVKEYEFYILSSNSTLEEEHIKLNYLFVRINILLLSEGALSKLIPGFLRAMANGIDLMIQERERSEKEK
jgi:hypothetical protein